MSNEKTGGPAFPNIIKISDENFVELRGMDLRDYFAAKAMQIFIENPKYKEFPNGELEEIPAEISAYEMADAMLKAREE